ncbi:MAG: lipoyl synthase [Candidatus Omnitrophota bacterium]
MITTKPNWIRGKVSWEEDFEKVRKLLDELKLNSVCVSAACPNRGECWQARHVTFMILGKICTRGCSFCNITGGSPEEPDPNEPENIAEAVKKLGVKYVVITSVTRDDLFDKGAGQFIKTIWAIKKNVPEALVEVLIPDFGANEMLLSEMIFSGADVIGHNIEMPEALYADVRPKAYYARSLEVLSILKRRSSGTPIKSSIIIGLGEKEDDIFRTLEDLKDTGVDIVYIGQYLSPSRDHWPVKKYYGPSEFHSLRKKAREMGFKVVLSGPMVRSSYRAYESYLACL